MSKNNSKKVIVLLGSTSSGKTAQAVKLAHIFNGEIVSADSRQVYSGMDIGTGKDLKEFSFKGDGGINVSIPYHLIDIVDPMEVFDVVEWTKRAKNSIDNILSKGRVPIVTGGTGLYLQALVDNYDFSEAKPDLDKRSELEDLSNEALLSMIKEISYDVFDQLDENDRGNKRRLIRYIELIENEKDFALKKSVRKNNQYEYLLLGLNYPREEINKRIRERLIHRIEKEGMIDEVKKLHNDGVSWKRFEELGMEYRNVSKFLQNKMTYEEMIEKTFIAIRQFAKRQTTWFRRWERQGAKIYWENDLEKSKKLIENFLKKK
ncbi:tRNA (adenosine(37)-N6)-dimethylallyltransferase MiaA [Candidatus Parcubacteria bacterium]|nr:MAG: tRNA (adenosine(37)-N6)-dimethylallyltransferase MiaA [Candidatus Parcubacteria bacterium]